MLQETTSRSDETTSLEDETTSISDAETTNLDETTVVTQSETTVSEIPTQDSTTIPDETPTSIMDTDIDTGTAMSTEQYSTLSVILDAFTGTQYMYSQSTHMEQTTIVLIDSTAAPPVVNATAFVVEPGPAHLSKL